MSWSCHLPPVSDISIGATIISKDGLHLGHKGDWRASMAEEVRLSNTLKMNGKCLGESITYNGRKFMIVHSDGLLFLALKDREGLIAQQSKKTIICVHFNKEKGQIPQKISGKIYDIVRYFMENFF